MEELLRLLELQADAVTGRPVEIPFEAQDTSMLPEGEKIDRIKVTPLKVGTVFRITPLLSRIKEKDLEKITVSRERNFDPGAVKIFGKYQDLIIEIICVGIHNRQSNYPDYLKSFLTENCTWEDLHVLLNAVLFRLGTMHFIRSTTTLRTVGLSSAAEIIALQKNRESWKKPSAPSPSW